jgi:hypothetical protein
MAHSVWIWTLPLSLVLFTAGTGSAQDPTSSRVADVYVGTTNGVYLYHAQSNGALTAVSGSPFSIAGTAVGSNHAYFFSQDPSYLHSYAVRSNGAIGAQAAQVNTQNFSGSECGKAELAFLAHSGQDVYSQLQGDPNGGSDGSCVALQSFRVSNAGAFTFLAGTEFATEGQTGIGGSATTVKLTGSGNYAYSGSYDEECQFETFRLKRENSGAMLLDSYGYLIRVPSTPSDWRWYPWYMTADPTNHMAIGMIGESGSFGPCGDEGHLAQIGSFTVGSDGSLTTANTPDQMPTPTVFPNILNMSASGQFLAVGGSETFDTGDNGTQSTGLQVFHFNGASPVTPYSKVLTTDPINEIHWDRNQHLYALSESSHKLYVYTVTSSGIIPAPGSPYSIPSTPNALSIAPVMCSAPSSDGIHICDPIGGSTVAAPVLVEASAKVSGNIARMELWVDGAKRYTTNSPELDTTIGLAAGKHRFAVIAVNTAGQKWQNAIDATVK